MKKTFILLVILLFSLPLYSFKNYDNETTVSTTDTDPDIGKDIYFSQGCAACHKINGIGGAFGPDLTDINEKSDEYINNAIMNPSSVIVKGYKNIMPSYKNTLSEADVANIIAFFRNFKKK